MSEREQLFDQWAKDYDRSVQETDGFPFAGYEEILNSIVRESAVRAGDRILDLGVGTGALAGRFVELGCEVWGLDFSERMLERARARFPGARFLKADLLDAWPGELPDRFAAVVSGYVLHEFGTPDKLKVVKHALERLSPGAQLVVGDIAFRTRALHDAAQAQWANAWDAEEAYWVWEELEPQLREVATRRQFSAYSFCGGVMTFLRQEAE